MFPWIDLALVDIKAINPTIHKAETGVDNRIILENILRISFITKVTVRIPVIPGFNDNAEEIQAIGQFAQMMSNVDTIHLLPYHNYGENKYSLLGLSYPLQGIESNLDEKIDQLKSKVESMGFTCHIGG
ncbi:4-hydroxyphenylacetate decarboxylase activating enzyme [Vibrio celticus]|uniref:4-hydroxyphenylacetate decarboxylase activating enzyme n=1 Tax=Vibrio celticus TaxID=446372 RepID=A0A1C3JEC1_9VIBR|nr:4-hydroxyphenylacetate decarboxylase activating enzyme [Vibrio celticus]